MNRRGEEDGGDWFKLISDYFSYLIFFVVFFAITLGYIFYLQDGAGMKEDFYAKEIAYIINTGLPGQQAMLDITPVSSLMVKYKQPFSDVFVIDNVNHEVLVKLTPRSGVRYPFFNDVSVVDVNVSLISGNADSNRLSFRLEEARGP